MWSDGDISTSNDSNVGAYILSADPNNQADFLNSFPSYDYSTTYGEGAHGDVWLNSSFIFDWDSADLGSIQL